MSNSSNILILKSFCTAEKLFLLLALFIYLNANSQISKDSIQVSTQNTVLSAKMDSMLQLAISYKQEKKYEKAIESYQVINQYLEKNSVANFDVNLYIAECYFALNDIEYGEKYLKRILIKPENDYEYLTNYYRVEATYYSKIGDFKKASNSLKLERYYLSSMYKDENVSMKDYIKVKSNLEKSALENQKIKSEFDLNQKKLRYRNIVLVLGILSIAILLIYYLIQIKSQKFKIKAHKELFAINKKLQEINSKLIHTLDVKKKFIDEVTFEMRSPLISIKGFSKAIRKEPELSKKKELTDSMSFTIEYLLSFVNQMIDANVEGSENSIAKLKNESTSLESLLTTIVESLKLNSENSGTIRLEIDKDISRELKIDKYKLTQLFLNLDFLGNYLKTDKRSDILISANLFFKEKEKETIRFSITDSGINAEKEKLERLYSLYFENIEFNRKFSEMKIIVLVLQRLLHVFKTKIEVEYLQNDQPRISFSIDFEPELTTAKALITEENRVSNLKIKVLLVEDNKINQLITKKILVNNGFECDVADDGLQVVEKVKQSDYSLILMDIMMPVMDGFEASFEIKNIKSYIPIVALTAVSEVVNQEKFVSSKIEKVLTKPVDVTVLCNTIRNFINR